MQAADCETGEAGCMESQAGSGSALDSPNVQNASSATGGSRTGTTNSEGGSTPSASENTSVSSDTEGTAASSDTGGTSAIGPAASSGGGGTAATSDAGSSSSFGGSSMTSGGAGGMASTASNGTGGVSGTSSDSAGGAGGAPPARDEPPFETFVGRLSPEPRFCWVSQQGNANEAEWLAKRESLQEVISAWRAPGFEIQWLAECPSLRDMEQAEVRILLDDRLGPDLVIPGCGKEDREGPWAVYPFDASYYSLCEWNMVLPFYGTDERTALHTVGHALGFSHEHVREVDPPPLCPAATQDEPTNPYLASYDPNSAMHYGHSQETAFDGAPWASCEEFDALGLSSGDALALEMLYPDGQRRSLAATGWLPFAQTRVVRSDVPLKLANTWVYRGAAASWFPAHFWTVTTSEDPTPAVFDELVVELDPAQAQRWWVEEVFTDPLGSHHWLAEEIEVSDTKHTAVVMSLL